MTQIIIDQGDNNKTFDAKTGDLITVALKETPTTGYRWEVDGIDEKIIFMENSHYSKSSNSDIGGGGTRTFNFRAHSSGKAKVQLSLKREWEKETSPTDQFVVFIQIT